MTKLHLMLMGTHLLLPGTWTPSPTPWSPAGWQEFPKCALIALGTSVALDVTIFLGILCLVTADCFKLVCPKKSHFNQKNRNAIFFFLWVGVCPTA